MEVVASQARQLGAVGGAVANPGVHSLSLVPFDWEETPGTPKCLHNEDGHTGFSFKKPGCSAPPTTAADELFEEGRIKPLKLPPRMLEAANIQGDTGTVSARWARSTSPLFRSPRRRDKVEGFDPFERAIEQAISRSLTKEDVDSYCGEEANVITADNCKKKRHWKDFLSFKAVPPGRRTGRSPRGKDPVCNSSSASILPSKAALGRQRSSSFRFAYEHGPVRKLGSITTKELAWGSFRMIASEELARRPLVPYRRPLLRRLDPRPAIQNVLRRVLGS